MRQITWLCAGALAAMIQLAAVAQTELRVLKAESAAVDVQDGPRLFKGIWNIDPSVELDTYNAARSDKPKTVTFITDVDRLSFEVEPNRTYDFVILFKGKDRCRTRISTMVQPFKRTATGGGAEPVSIPFDFDRGMIIVKARVNGSTPLDLLFDTGADANVIQPSAVAKGAAAKVDGVQSHIGFGGTTTSQSASDNTIELDGARWDHEPIIWSEQQTFGFDGILGAHVFEDKVVEIDFDRKVLVVTDAAPSKIATYSSLPMHGEGRTFSIDVGLGGGKNSGGGRAFVDTGFAGALLVYADTEAALGLHGVLSRVGRSSTSGTGRGAIDCDILILPKLEVAGTSLQGVPIHVERSGGPPSYSGAVIGMDALKRFNLVLDYPRDRMYLAPNTLVSSPFSITPGGPPWKLLAIGLSIVVAVVVGLVAALRARLGRTTARA